MLVDTVKIQDILHEICQLDDDGIREVHSFDRSD